VTENAPYLDGIVADWRQPAPAVSAWISGGVGATVPAASPSFAMRRAAVRLSVLLAFLTAPAALSAQLKVTRLAAEADVTPFYAETTWGSLRGGTRLTTPLLNITFVTDSGFRPSARGTVDRALPASLRLAGLRPVDFQEIADAVHDAFVAELKAQGMDLLPYEPLTVNPGFQELADHAPRSGREQIVSQAYQAVASVSGARKTTTFVGHHCPWVESFLSANYLPATRLTRELGVTLPVVSFLVDFVEYSTDRTITYDWSQFGRAGAAADVPRLRARPHVYVAAGSITLLTPDSQTAALVLTAPLGYDNAFVVAIHSIRGRDREERAGGSYEVTVDPAAFQQAVTAALTAHVKLMARKVAAGAR
jgi:hypothetical protein